MKTRDTKPVVDSRNGSFRAVIRFGRCRACHVKTLLAFDSKTGKLRAWSQRSIGGWAASHIDETERPAWLKRAEEAFRNDDGTAISRMIR